VRDTIGLIPDILLSPVNYATSRKLQNTLNTVDLIQSRASYLSIEDLISGDRYIFIRDAYLQRREYLIFDGEIEDDFEDY